jgi:hypothetical protein
MQLDVIKKLGAEFCKMTPSKLNSEDLNRSKATGTAIQRPVAPPTTRMMIPNPLMNRWGTLTSMMTMMMNLIPRRGCKALASPFWAKWCFLYTGWRLFCWLTVGVGAHVALFAFSETNSGGIEVYFLFDTINSDGVDDSMLLEMVNFDVWSFCYFLCGLSL